MMAAESARRFTRKAAREQNAYVTHLQNDRASTSIQPPSSPSSSQPLHMATDAVHLRSIYERLGLPSDVVEQCGGMIPVLIPPQLFAQLSMWTQAMAPIFAKILPSSVPASDPEISQGVSGDRSTPQASASAVQEGEEAILRSAVLPRGSGRIAEGIAPCTTTPKSPLGGTSPQFSPVPETPRSAASTVSQDNLFVTPEGPLRFHVPSKFNGRTRLMRTICRNGGELTTLAECDYALVNGKKSASTANSTKVGVRTLPLSWVHACLKAGELLPEKSYSQEDASWRSHIIAIRAGKERSPRSTSHDTVKEEVVEAGSPPCDQEECAAPTLPNPPTKRVKAGLGYLFTDEDDIYIIEYANARLLQEPRLSMSAIIREVAENCDHHSPRSWETHFRKHIAYFSAQLVRPSAPPEEDDSSDDEDAEPCGPPPTPPAAPIPEHRPGYNKYTDEDVDYLIEFSNWMYAKDPDCSQNRIFEELAERAPHHSSSSWSYFFRRHYQELEPLIIKGMPDNEECSPTPERSNSTPANSSRPSRTIRPPKRFRQDRQTPPPPPPSVRGRTLTEDDDKYLIQHGKWYAKWNEDAPVEEVIKNIADSASTHSHKAWSSRFREREEYFIFQIFGVNSRQMQRFRASQTTDDEEDEEDEEDQAEAPKTSDVEVDLNAEENSSSVSPARKRTRSSILAHEQSGKRRRVR